MLRSSLHEFFTSNEFSGYVCAVFDVLSSKTPQRAAPVQLATSVYCECLEQLVSFVKKQQQEVTIEFDVDQMSGVGRSKVRHVGAWAVRKVLNCSRKYIQRNVFTKCSSTLARVETQQIACHSLEGIVI